jgi:diacylglycerol kinase family enzyme
MMRIAAPRAQGRGSIRVLTGMAVAIILNPSSGLEPGGVGPDVLLPLFNSVGLEPDIHLIGPGESIADVVRRALNAGSSAVVAAGGDGTVGAVAAELLGTSVPLGVLPVGTLNHFARDAGIPLRLADAARVIAEGRTAVVDVGEVNGRFFLNNSSIGFYPLMVRRREGLQSRGVPKPLATVAAVVLALMRFPNLTVRITAENSDLVARTPFVFVGNNEYELAGPRAGRRAALQTGEMHVCVGKTLTRSALLRAAVLALFGRTPAPPELETLRATRVRVRTMRRRVRVALDGELVLMRSPLDYAIRPGALAVLTPEGEE